VIDIVFLERKVIIEKREQAAKVKARQEREKKPPSEGQPTQKLEGIPAAIAKINSTSDAQRKKHAYRDLSSAASSVAEYVSAMHGIPPQHWQRVAKANFTETHPLVQEEGTMHNVAFSAAMRAINKNRVNPTDQKALRKLMCAALKRKFQK
jgi:ATP-dependent Clp protease ATP-binding subunit ClpA